MEEILAHLMAMRTFSNALQANEEALDYIERYLVQRGMHAKRFTIAGHGALVATVKPNDKKPKVLLAAHVDVMPGSDGLFTLKKAHGNILGRGTFDMKFAIAAYMKAIDEVKDDIGSYDLGVMITTDEELGCIDDINGTKSLLEDEEYRPQVCVLLDGGDDWKIQEFAKGYWRFDMIARGATAHASRPWEGDSASFKLIEALHQIKALFADQGKSTDTLNIGIMQAGDSFNQIPDHATAGIELRLISDDSVELRQQQIKAICDKYDIAIATRVLHNPAVTDLNDPFVLTFRDSIKKITGEESGTCISYAASDAEYFTPLGIPTIVTRPPGGGLHGEDEWMSEKGFLQLSDVIKDYLQTVAYTKSPGTKGN